MGVRVSDAPRGVSAAPDVVADASDTRPESYGWYVDHRGDEVLGVRPFFDESVVCWYACESLQCFCGGERCSLFAYGDGL